ncbi:endoribonuclease Dicer-like isoform X2 [Uloborus diversus]|uniref:endoribonuclease Dicer-like isoform X2 n=1 Tax=Uloborus diversus TaxID=327109 RepID=UPI00240A5BEB|nr:endoribonuclease Dicer-like isoform X2 [Uloborus diversus]
MASNNPTKRQRLENHVQPNDESFTPRAYQVEILEAALKDNVIACLGTGTGKTFIAVLLIRENLAEVCVPYEEGGKRIFFLVPTVPLVRQQRNTIAMHTNLRVKDYYGDMNVDSWNKDRWISEFTSCEVLVMTAEIFRIITDHAFIPLERIKLLIIDECHRAQGDHPYRQALKCFASQDRSQMPRIFGLSASLLNGKCKPHHLEKNLKELEKTLQSTIITSSDITEIQKYGTDPDEYVVYYKEYAHQEKELNQRIIELLNRMKSEKDAVRADSALSCTRGEAIYESEESVVFFEKPTRCLNALLATLQTLGPWCASKAAGIFSRELGGILLKTRILMVDEKYRKILEEVNEFLVDFINRCASVGFEFKRNNVDAWPSQLKRLLDILIAAKNCSRFEPEALPVRNISFEDDPEEFHKMQKQKVQTEVKSICSIVFVKQRITAFVLCQWLLEIKKEFPELHFMSPEFIVGHGTTGIQLSNMSDKRQMTVLKDFREKNCNILFATSVLEEGMDIRQCNLVIRFDLPQDFRAYVQSKGRARAQNSVYVLMANNADYQKFLCDLCNFKTIEQMLLSKCTDREMPTEEEIATHMADDKIPPYMPYGSKGARITMMSAISVINRYCSKLPSDMATKLVPIWKIDTVDVDVVKKQYICTLRMPINSALRTPVVGEQMPQKRLAKMAAALKACQILHKLGELNENLVPISCLVDNAANEEIGPIDEESADGAQPGTNRRRQIYDKKAIFLKNSRPTPGAKCYLHFLDMKLVTPLPKRLNPRGRAIIDPASTTRGLALLSSKKLPSINPFPVFNKSGRILVSISFCKSLVLSHEELSKLEEFHHFIFSDALWIERNKTFAPVYADASYYVVPVNQDLNAEIEVDWNFIHQTKDHPYNRIKLMTSRTDNRTMFDENLFTDAVLLRSYQLNDWKTEPPTFHHVAKIHYDKTPLSEFETEKYPNYKQYFKEKYSIDIQIDKQPLVETVENRILHLWKPLYISVKQSYDEEGVSSKTKLRRQNYREYLVPELCIIHPFPSSFMFKVLCLPTILFRLTSLSLAEEIRQTVAAQGFIGKVDESFTWPEFQLESSDKELRKHLISLGEIKNSFSTNEVPQDIVKRDGKVISFVRDVPIETHPGPNPSLILKALTTKSAGDEFDLERLEMIGDSFLKYVMSIKTYIQFPTFDEGKLTKLRSQLIQNLRLYQCAKKRNLGQYMICNVFSCNSTWLPPCYVVEESVDPKAVVKLKKKEDDAEGIKYSYFTKSIISDKCLADSVEALIGAYLLSCGQKGALMFMSWMGLNPLPNIKDHEASKEDFQNWPNWPPPPNPILSELPPNHVQAVIERLTLGFDEFEKIIKYKFKNKAYLLQAFTHPSYSFNEITDCYQRLEFLGDAVLDFMITRQLYEDPNDHSPGKLTDLRSALVNNNFFASLAVKYNYHKFLKILSPHLFKLLGNFVELLCSSVAFQEFQVYGYYLEETECFALEEVEVPKALGDIFESVAGAIYLDSGMSIDAVWDIYYPMIAPALKHLSEHVPINPVRALYELVGSQDVFGKPVTKEGKDKTYIEVNVLDQTFVGVGPNKKVAKRSAAKRAIAYAKEQTAMMVDEMLA